MNEINWEKLRIPLLLTLLVAFAFFLRVYWAVGPSIEYGYAVSGGSDSYYHERIINYILSTGHQLLNDPMLNYPIGMDNPRPPLFHWGIVMLSFIFRPFMSAWDAAVLSLIIFPAIWGSLILIPIYLLGREAYNKKVGILAAFFFAIMPGAIGRSVATQADWDAFDLFFIAWTFYFFLKALKLVRYKYWIRDWFDKTQVKAGLKEFFGENKDAVIYSALSGAAMGSLALAWKGYTYALTILAIYLFVQVFINRFRNKSNLHMVVFTGMFILFSFGMSFPWYYITNRISEWYAIPLVVIAGVFVIALFLEVTGKYPWPFVFSVAAGIIAAGLLIINIFLPDMWQLLVSGQGYFVKSKLYSTIAEAQPASLGYLAMSFGVAIFILAFGGIVLLLLKMRKDRNEYYLFFVFYSIIAIYMALSAARFIFNATVPFALMGAIAVIWLVEVLRFRESMEEYRKYSGSAWKKLKSTVKFSQIAFVLVIAFLLVVPTVWSAVDAGIPYEDKKKFDKQIYDIMPSFMRPNETTYKKSSPWYLGAFGYSLPKPDYPWERAWKWLREQDNNTPPEYRPGFVSWWDYGFSAIRQGQHPAIADNFQNGYQMAAQIITAQNESEVISLFIIRLMEGDYYSHNKSFSPGMLDILHHYFTDAEVKHIKEAFKDPEQFKDTVVNNPDYYGIYESDISGKNLEYAYLKGMFAHRPESKLISLYDAVRNYTHHDIRYFAVDYRLFPFSGRNTGIFYAPAKLGDRRVHQYGGTVVPYDFYVLKAVDQYGNEYDLNKVPAKVRIVNYKIEYKPMFYDSMLYRTFIGYSGKEVGAVDGIPGISPGLYNYYPMQAWDMAHFKLVYRTAYWNPYKDYQNHTNAWKPIPIEQALKYAKENKGVVELNPPAYQVLPNDVVIVKFYEGAIIDGTVKLTDGEPLKHVRVTLLDEYGIPHVSVYTDSHGHFRIPAVAGNLTLVVSTNGGLNKLKLVEKTILYRGTINVSEEQAMRLKPNYVIKKDIVLKPSNLDGVVYFDLNQNNKFDNGDVRIKSGVFVLRNETYGFNKTCEIVNGLYHINNIPPHRYTADLILNGRYFADAANISIGSNQNLTKDIGIVPSRIHGEVTYSNGAPASNATVVLKGVYASYEVKTANNGSYSVYVVPDNYTVYAHMGNYVSHKDTVIVNLWNYTTSENLTLRHAFIINGFVEYNGVPVSHIPVKITSELLPHNIYIVTTDDKGHFNLEVPGGIYSIYSTSYVGTTRVAYVGFLNLDSNKNLVLRMSKGYSVSGYVHAPKNVKNIEIGIYGNGVFYRTFVNNTGYYEAYLPEGRYVVGVLGFGEKSAPYFAREIIHLSAPLTVNIELHRAYNVTGVVYFDRNGNGIVDENEIIRNGLVCLYDSHGIYEIRNIPPDGRFVLPTNVNYHVKVILWGYSVKNIEYHGNSVHVVVNSSFIHVTGYLKTQGHINTIPVNIRFIEHYGNYTHVYEVTGVTSHYSTYLPPGNYTVEFYGYNRTYRLNNYSFVVPRGFANFWFNTSFIAYAHITLVTQGTGATWFLHGHNFTSGKTVTLPINTYTLYVYNRTSSNVLSIRVEHNDTIEVPVYPSYYVGFDITNYTERAEVHVYAGNVSLTVTGSIKLPEGSYDFVVNDTRREGESYYNYFAENRSFVNSDTVVALHVTKRKVVTHLVGYVLSPHGAIANCIVHLHSLNGFGNFTVVTDSNGKYTVDLTPGKYMIYTSFIFGSEKYANISFVALYRGSREYDIHMVPGYYIRGGTFLNGVPVSTVVNFGFNGSVISVQSSGYYWVILPPGNYSVSSEKSREEYGLNVGYSFNGHLNLTTHDVDLNIYLVRDSYHLVTGKVIAVDEQVSPNSTMGVTVLLKNGGNSPEKVRLEGVGEWSVIGNHVFKMNPGDTKTVSLKVHVPYNAKYGADNFKIRILFSQYSRDIIVHTNVSEVFRAELSESLDGWSNNSLVYTVTIHNEGNTAVNYTLGILNAEELNAKGWKVHMEMDKHVVRYVNVPANDYRKIKVIAVATKEVPSTVVPITLSAFGGREYIIHLALYHPEVSQNSLYVKGENVQNYSGMTIDNYTYAVWISAAVIAIVILWIGRYRK